MPYYHATTRDRIESIQKHGLGGAPLAKKNFEGAQSGVYLAEEPMFAVGFMIELMSEGKLIKATPKESIENVVVFVIDDSRVDKARLTEDANTGPGFWLYHGVIDVTAMPIVSAVDIPV